MSPSLSAVKPSFLHHTFVICIPVLNSAHKSFCTVKVKHPTIRKTRGTQSLHILFSLALNHLAVCVCAANPYPDVRRRYWNAYMLFYQKISDQNSPVLPKKSRVSIMRQEAEDLTLWVNLLSLTTPIYFYCVIYNVSVSSQQNSAGGRPSALTAAVCRCV